MFQHLIVPVDGSEASWRAVAAASRLAAAADRSVEVVQIINPGTNPDPAQAELEDGLARLGALPVAPTITVVEGISVAAVLSARIAARPDTTIAMASTGHGRMSPLLGSIANEILQELDGPIIVFGPQIDVEAVRLDGNYIVALDGSRFADRMAPIAVQWAATYGASPWLVEVLEPGLTTGDLIESAHLMRTAKALQEPGGPEIGFDALRGDDPGDAIWDFARSHGTSLIFMSTHGRTGFARIRLGSVAAAIVRHATVPVVLYRPSDLDPSDAAA